MNGDFGKRLTAFALTVAVVLSVAAVIRYVFTPHRFSQNGTNGAGGLPSGVAVRSERNTFIGYLNQTTQPAWILRADVVDISSDKTRVEARGNVEAELLDAPTGKRRAFVTAPTAVFTKSSNTLQVGGKIVCRAPGTNAVSDLRVEAETLVWNVGAKQVLCSGLVHATLPNNTGTADGRDLTLDLTTKIWSLQKPRMALVVPEGAGDAPPPFVNPLKNLPL